ncbi:hypothetical protein J7400_10920 [Shimia sp. R9_2]|uniref:hypothetical protein n=1 Tax=Shimia sp. R9_2 TaxID=2821112 RepID=UPI001AD9B012|nr:hypothetical protein [Shimia sp. R9_2]MBO9397193.1 hypothetical protein [Shimia sp. R9_2]
MCIFSLNPLREVQDFAYQHDQALQSASLVLAGQFALKRTQSLLDEIRSANAMTRRLQRGIVELHKLLSLYYVHDENSIEAAYFADLDPSAPYVEEICLLTEALTDLLTLIDCAPGQPLSDYLLAA